MDRVVLTRCEDLADEALARRLEPIVTERLFAGGAWDGLPAGSARQAREFLARLGTVGSDLYQVLILCSRLAEAAGLDVGTRQCEASVNVTGRAIENRSPFVHRLVVLIGQILRQCLTIPIGLRARLSDNLRHDRTDAGR